MRSRTWATLKTWSCTQTESKPSASARTPAEVDANDAGAELTLTAEERAKIDAILAGVAGRVKEFTPLRPAMEPWGEVIPAGGR